MASSAASPTAISARMFRGRAAVVIVMLLVFLVSVSFIEGLINC